MPRTRSTRSTTKQPDREWLIALSEVWTGITNLRVANLYAVTISPKKDPEYLDHLAEKFGGQARFFTSGSGKSIYGWFVTSQQKLDYLTQLEEAGLLDWLDVFKRDGIRARLQKDIDEQKGNKD
jgi:hypothetical protein